MKNKLRWKLGLVILLVIALIETAIWIHLGRRDDKSAQVMSLTFSVFVSGATILLWWTFASGLRWKTRLLGLAVVALVSIGLSRIVRIDGVSGEMYFNFVPAWKTTPVERAARLNEVADADDFEEARLELQEGDWPQYLGPRRDGTVDVAPFPRDWEPENFIWKRAVGLGWGSFAIVGNRVWTQEQRGEFETVVCYEARTGKQIWVHRDSTLFSETLGGDGPRATPTFHEGRIYAQGATGILNCLDARSGEQVWTRNILDDAGAENLAWGMSGSPLVHGDAVIVSPGGPDGSSLVAYHRKTGESLWSAGNAQASYSSPMTGRIRDEDQILVFNAEGLFAHRPEDGTPLWDFPYTNTPRINVPQPWVIEEGDAVRILLPTGYSVGTTLLDLQGDENGKWSVSPRWKSRFLRPKFSTVVVRDGHAYGADEGILACIELESGKRKWKDGRYGYGQLLLVGDMLLIQAEDGHVALVEASPEAYREISRFPALEGKTWNHPAISGSLLLLRNGQEACAFSLPGPATDGSS